MSATPELSKIINDATSRHPSNVDDAVDRVLSVWRDRPSHPRWLDRLEREHIRTLIHDARHASNKTTRRRAGFYGGKPKVRGVSGGVSSAAAAALRYDVMNTYYVDGRLLGDLTRSELCALADNEDTKSRTHTFNAMLARGLRDMIPEKSTRKTCRRAIKGDVADALVDAICVQLGVDPGEVVTKK